MKYRTLSTLIGMSMASTFAGDALAQTYCSWIAHRAYVACKHEYLDDWQISRGNCTNESDRFDRADCIEDAGLEREETAELCELQRDAREALCGQLGEGRYDPDWDPADFVEDPTGIDAASANPYFPLVQGARWVYEGVVEEEEGDIAAERITVVVTDETKFFSLDEGGGDGVNCLTVNDLVEEVDPEDLEDGSILEVDGVNVEDTDDWYAQDLDGNVWYCGEISLNYEFFEGDEPEEAELVDIEGSWKGFRDGAKPGILMQAEPEPGQVYRQEIALGDAEDTAEVLSTTASGFHPGDDCGNADLLSVDVEALLETYCAAGDCLVTREFTPVEPGVEAHKYYAPGVGMILEVEGEEMNCVALVETNL